MFQARWMRTVGVMGLGAFLGGCAMYSVAGQFEESGMAFYGYATVSPVDVGLLEVETEDGGISCSGTTRVTQSGAMITAVGAQGSATATCSDGRTFKLDFVQTTEGGGHGQGIDNRGNIVQVYYDMSANTARARLNRKRLDNLVQ